MGEMMEDRAGEVRAGEELEAVRLEAYLRARLALGAGALAVEQFGSGYSNLTYLLRVGGQELVLRRPPRGAHVKGGHDMGREYRILRGLEGVYAKAPRALLFCEDEAVIGAPFYVMERVQGVILRAGRQAGAALDEPTLRRVSEALVQTLVDLHAIDYAAAGLSGLGRPEGYVQRQVEGWRGRYAQAATDHLPAMERVGAWLAANMPPTSGAALIHNDFKLDNVVLDAQDLTRVRAVLDWEMATIGDPLMDLGTTLAYWVEEDDPPVLQRIGLGRLGGGLRRADVVALYAGLRGLAADRFGEEMVFYQAFGMFKVAVIAQQIYYRYQQGFTRDPRFGGLDAVVAACAEMAARVIV